MDKKWWTLLAVCAGMFMLLLDVTIVIVAQPAIQDGLHASFTDVQWVLDSYALTLASLLLTAGVLADRYGRKLLFQIGLVIFTLGSLLCGVAQDPLMLIVSRSGQGVGGAIMFATSLALLGQSFRGRDRGVAFGVWGGVTGVSTALGPVLGGVITTNWSWRGIFLVNVPIGVLAVALTAWRVEESKSPHPTPPDWAGFALLTTGLVSLVYGLIRAGESSWSDAGVIICLAISVVALGGFIVAERRVAYPMFDLSLLRVPTFAGSSIAAFAMNGSLYAVLLWLGGAAEAWVVSASQPELCLALSRELCARNEASRAQTALVFLRPNGVQPSSIEALHGLKGSCVVGAGTLADSDVYAVASSGTVSMGAAGALTLRGVPSPILASSPACKLLMPLREISEVRGSMVLTIEGEPALEVLSTVAHALVDQPLVFVALASERGEGSVRPPLLLRAVQGVDPARHGLIVSEEVKKGMRNATLMAIAPTANMAHAAGTTPGLDPQFSQIFSRTTLSGKFLEVNHNLVRDLKAAGLWERVREDILRAQGDIQGIETIPDRIKAIYRTSFQLSPHAFIEVAGRAQKWIDQSISRNMYLETRDTDEMVNIYASAWEKGLKTTYYLHMKPRHTAEQSTVKVNKAADIAKPGAKTGFGFALTK